jgi:hypothetical protein
MMVASLERAAADSGAPKLLQRADSICVLRGMWAYGNAGREISHRVGAAPQETVGTPYGGNFSQACVIDASREGRPTQPGSPSSGPASTRSQQLAQQAVLLRPR